MRTKKEDKPWTPQDEEFLRQNINSLSVSDIAVKLGRTENCVNIKCHRLRVDRKKGGLKKELVSRNLILEMLKQRIGDPESFRYTPGFRQRTKIGQKRFWQLYRGEKNVTEDEYLLLAKEWNLTLQDAFDVRQIKLDF